MKFTEIGTHKPQPFKKSEQERAAIITAKKANNKKWRKLFGCKRVSAGVVKRHFAGVS